MIFTAKNVTFTDCDKLDTSTYRKKITIFYFSGRFQHIESTTMAESKFFPKLTQAESGGVLTSVSAGDKFVFSYTGSS